MVDTAQTKYKNSYSLIHCKTIMSLNFLISQKQCKFTEIPSMCDSKQLNVDGISYTLPVSAQIVQQLVSIAI